MVFHNACFFVALFALLLAMSEAYDYYSLPDTPPSVCFKAPERGPCDAELKRWFSNQTSGKCEAFIWGGCKNKRRNNFKTKADCEARCIDPWEDPNKHRDPEGICKLPMDAGYGKMKDVTKYYYSYKYKTCVGFKYLGNGGNDNRFVSIENCLQRCNPDMQELAGYVCEQPVKALSCANKYDTGSTAMRRWYYNMALDKCEEFVFGGCSHTLADGNQNNFASKKDCVARCKHYRPNSFTTSTSYAWASTTTPATLCPVELPEYDDITGTTAAPDQRRLSAKRCDMRCQSMNMVGVFKRRPTKDGCWYTCKCECPKPIKRKKCKRKCKKQGYGFTWHPTFLYSGQGGSYEEDPYRCKKVCACDGKYQGVVGQKTPDDPENPSSLASLLTGDHPKKKARNML